MHTWTKTYKPFKVEEVIGNELAKKELELKITTYRKGNKPILLHGGTGNGKTCSVQAIAKQHNMELVELNASDTRKADVITSLLKGVLNQTSLFQKKKLILIDEIEGISGTKDRGALKAVEKLTKVSQYPIVLIAHDAYSDKAKPIRKQSELIQYKPLNSEEVTLILKKILEKEKIGYEEQALKQLARMSGGDARAAINDLQKIAGEKITSESVKELNSRDNVKPISQALSLIFKSKSPEVVLSAFDEVEEDLDAIFLWVENNLPKEYKDAEDLSKGFDNLAEADKHYGRIKRRQYYRLYVYCYNLLTAGISLSKKERNKEHINYERSNKPLKIWILRNANAKKRDIANKLAEKTHTSQKEAFDNINYLAGMLKSDYSKEIIQELDLNSEEVDWIKNKV